MYGKEWGGIIPTNLSCSKLAILFSPAFNPCIKFFSKLFILSLSILILYSKFLINTGLKTLSSNYLFMPAIVMVL